MIAPADVPKRGHSPSVASRFCVFLICENLCNLWTRQSNASSIKRTSSPRETLIPPTTGVEDRL